MNIWILPRRQERAVERYSSHADLWPCVVDAEAVWDSRSLGVGCHPPGSGQAVPLCLVGTPVSDFDRISSCASSCGLWTIWAPDVGMNHCDQVSALPTQLQAVKQAHTRTHTPKRRYIWLYLQLGTAQNQTKRSLLLFFFFTSSHI